MSEYDASNPKHVAIQRRSAAAAEKVHEEFIKYIMGMVSGRHYLHDLLVRCHVFHNPFAANSRTTAFNCGELNIGQQVLNDIMRWCPDDYIQMMREANGRDAADDVRRSRSDEDTRRADSGSESPAYVHPGLDTFEPTDYTPTPDSGGET